jgi:hypothetical protein
MRENANYVNYLSSAFRNGAKNDFNQKTDEVKNYFHQIKIF